MGAGVRVNAEVSSKLFLLTSDKPQIDEDLDVDAEGLVTKKCDNSFWEIYRPLQDDIPAKRRLVATDPDTAIRIFDIHRDEELGALFIDRYKKDERYNSSAYFIALEIGSNIRRLHEPSEFWFYSLESIENPVGKWVGSSLSNSAQGKRMYKKEKKAEE